MAQKFSERKLEANRKNAQKSTGPKTREGKLAVRLNALKSGLFAKQVLITAGDGKEDKAEFEALRKDFHQRFQPVDAVEATLVEKMVVCVWRHRRVLRYETGEIRSRLDSAKREEENRQEAQLGKQYERFYNVLIADMFQDSWQVSESRLTLSEFTGTVAELQKTPRGLKDLFDLLESFTREIMETGVLSEPSQELLILNFVPPDKFHVEVICWCERREMVVRQPEDPNDPDRKQKLLETFKTLMLRRIVLKQAELQEKIQVAERSEALALEARLASLSQPPEKVMDNVMRAIASIDREFYRAWNQLERLQRQRKGETVPPPMSVNVN